MKAFFRRVKSQKGMSGVLVALLLVLIGVGLVMGVNSFMQDSKNTIIKDANQTITNTVTDATK